MSDLRNIMRGAALRRWPEWQFLRDAGVPAETAAYMHFTRQIGMAEIGIKKNRWEFKERGERAVILNVLGPGCEVVDIVAWRPDTPGSFWSYADGSPAVPYLGWHALEIIEEEHRYLREENAPEEWILEKGSLSVFEHPLDWLRAACEGIVVLDWARYWPAYLGGVAALKFTDRAFARRATSLFAQPIPVPPVLVAV